MKLSRRQQEIEARRASDPIAQFMEREDVDYTDPDQLPTAPRNDYLRPHSICPQCKRAIGLKDTECSGWHPDFKCECGFEEAGGTSPDYRFCPMCGKGRE